MLGSCVYATAFSCQGAGKDEQRARTASARRGVASRSPPSGALYLDTRFVHATATPPIVPLLDLTNLTHGSGTLPVAQHYAESQQPRLSASAGVLKNTNSGTNNRTRFMGGLQPPPRRIRYANGPPSLNAVRSNAAGHAVESPQLTNHESMPILAGASFQAPGLSHPRPPDVPRPTIDKDKGSVVGSGRDSLSARLARLAAGGSSGRVVPLKLV